MLRLIELYGKPRALRLDNGSEWPTSIAFTEWCQTQGIELRFIHPGKPDHDAFIERFLQQDVPEEMLSAHVFESLEQVREITQIVAARDTQERPHESRGQCLPR